VPKVISETATRTISGGEVVVSCLEALGAEFVFGVPGGQTLAVINGLERSPTVRFVMTHHESAAASMADAYGRLTGRPGVCIGTTGPGATNLLTGVGGALRDSSPVVVITCNNFTPHLERDDTQAADHISIFRPLTKRSWLVTETSVIPQVMYEAFLVATTGCPGPVHIDFTRTALESKVDPKSIKVPNAARVLATISQRPAGDRNQVSAATSTLRNARRPVLWVGHGLQVSGATEIAIKLAERLQMPILTTFNSIGAMPTRHPLVFGPRSRMGTALSAGILAEADVILAAGNSLNAVSTARWSTPMPELIIQIDIEPSVVGRNYGDRTIGIVGDARVVLTQIYEAMASDIGTQVVTRKAWLEELNGRKKDFYSQVASWRPDPPPPSGMVDPLHLVTTLRHASPDETMLVVDAGNPGVWTHFWEVREPDRYIKPVGFGNMGFGVPAAIAAKLVHSQVPVVALVGDGSLGMTLVEIETLVRERLDVCVVVMNDGGYGNIRQEQIYMYGKAGIGTDFGPIDYSSIAKACGLVGVTITSTAKLDDELRGFFSSPKPTLLDVQTDPAPNVWTFPLLVGDART
jgi:acetolactate synthase-1/2/3 large subunit